LKRQLRRRSDDLDKWVAILSKLAQCENGASDDQSLGLSFYAIRTTTVGDYHKLTEILSEMERKEFIQVFDEEKELPNGEKTNIKRYKITLKGIQTLFQILIPARDALRKLDY